MFDLPGRPIERDHENFLRETVASMCGLERSLRCARCWISAACNSDCGDALLTALLDQFPRFPAH